MTTRPLDFADTSSPERRRSGGGTGILVAAYASYGAFWGTWVVVFADFLAVHDLSAGEVSLGFTAMSLIAIGVMTFVAPRLETFARNTSLALALAVHAAGNGLIALVPGAWLAAPFVVMGLGTGLIDVFVNIAAQDLESRRERPVLQWVHAAYGAGGFVAALTAGALVTAGVPFRALIVSAAVAQACVGVFAFRSMALEPARKRSSGTVSLAVFRHRPGLIAPALVVMFSFFVEGSMDVWSVIFVRETLGASVMSGAAAFAAFALAITFGRAFAARILFGLGYRRTIIASALVSLLFATIAVGTSSTLVAAVAFLGLGFALSGAAPAAFGLAEGPDAGLAVGAMTTVGYSGFVFGPPVIGWLADNFGLRAAMGTLLVAIVGMALAGVGARRQPAVSRTG